ncbi:efflux RND transporter permease subunit, partial [Myxococcota bacterium]|nr:efflux RND transporter permease subunit [Myxococcota bacterium]
MKKRTPLATLIYLSMKNRLVVFILAAVMFGWGIIVSPFDFTLSFLPSSPLSVDALPDIGENQQIVFSKWPGAAPSDVDDQITYPLSQLLMGIPGVKTVRSSSMLGFSSVYVIFSEDVGFYWSRSRLLEKLSALPPNFLPEGVTPMLGPPGTALGQVFWYTVEGRDEKGNPAGGWDLAELRSVQDYFVRYRLSSVDGVAEVASIGGFVREFHVEVNPDSLRKYGVTLLDVYKAVHSANKDVGGRTLEINSVEYVIRGAGRAVALTDFSRAVIKTVGGVPVTVGQVAQVVEGPGLRRGLLDKEGTEAVGGVVTVTEGANTMLTVQRIRQRMKELSRGMPSKVLPDGRRSTLTVVPFYDRSVLIRETVKTLEHALRDEILVTIIVILVMLGHLKSSIIVSSILPLAVLLTFIIMKNLNMEGNILALSGIGIAIGTMVDMGIVITENIVRHLKTPREGEDSFQTILRATNEVASAVVTSVATTVVSFIPVFAMTATEGKLFKPLAYTKTFAIMGSLILALFLVPTLALTLLGKQRPKTRTMLSLLALAFSVVVTTRINMLLGMLFFTTTLYGFFLEKIPLRLATVVRWGVNVAVLLVAVWILSTTWSPLGSSLTAMDNFLMVSLLLGSILTVFLVFLKFYGPLLRWCLDHRIQFLSLMAFFMLTGVVVWKGFSSVSGFFPSQMVQTQAGYKLTKNFRGLEQQFMPDLDEGSFLYMPTVMPHASLGSAHRIMRLQDLSIRAIPEVQMVVGKLGRAQTPLDPAPISMFETIVTYKPEFLRSASGKLALFAHDASGSDWFRDVQGKKLPAPDGKPYKIRGRFKRDTKGALVADADGKPFRLWRSELLPRLNRGRKYWKGITGPDDIWKRITQRATVPGSTSAPKLQPISTRIVMLQTGIK